MKDVYFVTHAESRHHVEGMVGGWYATGLTATGQEQARRVAQCLKGGIAVPPRQIIASDLLRARETADLIADVFGCEVVTTSDLRELSYGVAEGKPGDLGRRGGWAHPAVIRTSPICGPVARSASSSARIRRRGMRDGRRR